MRRLGWRIPVAVAGLMAVLACVPTAGPPSHTRSGAIGAPCSVDLDCADEVCFTSTFPNGLSAPGGYCTAACSTNSDCGTGVCIPFQTGSGPASSFCLAACAAASDCRGGFACFQGDTGVCFSTDSLTCDPTAGSGTCITTNSQAGGCLRAALGPGKTGQCKTACNRVGPGVCGTDSEGDPFICVVLNTTVDVNTGIATGDTFHGAICSQESTTPFITGTECRTTLANGQTAHFADTCVDGDECYLKGMQPAGSGFDTAGDNLCHPLCGGTVVCSAGLTCRNVFGIANTGLCLP